MATPITRERLFRFFCSRFDADELRRFLDRFCYPLTRSMPESTAYAQFAFVAVECLERHGLIDEPLLESLLRERPKLKPEIVEIFEGDAATVYTEQPEGAQVAISFPRELARFRRSVLTLDELVRTCHGRYGTLLYLRNLTEQVRPEDYDVRLHLAERRWKESIGTLAQELADNAGMRVFLPELFLSIGAYAEVENALFSPFPRDKLEERVLYALERLGRTFMGGAGDTDMSNAFATVMFEIEKTLKRLG